LSAELHAQANQEPGVPHAPPNVETPLPESEAPLAAPAESSDSTPSESKDAGRGAETPSLHVDPSFEGQAQARDLPEPTFDTETSRLRVPNRALLATGAVIFAGAYVPSVIGAAISDRSGDDNLYIPFAGPWLALKRGESESSGEKALMVADGIAQGIGGLAVLLSTMIPERVTRSWYLIGQSQPVRVLPTRIARGGYGLTANANF
jgi:hypothetical protein